MPTFIKAGYWEKRVRPAQGLRGELNLDQVIDSKLPAPFDIGNLGFKQGSVGEKVSFTKDNYSSTKDVIIPGVLEIARGNNQGLYNAAIDNSYISPGPTNTEWSSPYIDDAYTSWAPLSEIGNRTFDDWRRATLVPGGNYAPPLQVGMPMVMRETTTGRTWLIMFSEWTPNDGGGGFAYDRWEILSGVDFEKPDYETSVVDKISDGVWLARNDNGALYNAVSETESLVGLSPVNTRWNSSYVDDRTGYSGFDDLTNLESRIYSDFTFALNYAVGNNILTTPLIMHDLTTDLYYKFEFTGWTSGGNGGGFAYTRTVIPQSKSIKFGDGSVINTAPSTTVEPVVDTEGNLIASDSSNDTVNIGPGGTHDIPNFSGMVLINDHYNGGVELWLCGGGPTTVLVSSTPYGPGAGDMTINGGINGYTWTNTNNQVGPFTFTVFKTRSEA